MCLSASATWYNGERWYLLNFLIRSVVLRRGLVSGRVHVRPHLHGSSPETVLNKPRSRRSSIAASRPLDAALAICSLYLSFVSINKPRILTWSWGTTVCPLMVNGSWSDLRVLGAKCTMAVLSASKVAPLRFSQSSASLIIASMPSRLLWADGPVTHAVKSSTNAIAPPWLSICLCTGSALKKRNRIGDRGEP